MPLAPPVGMYGKATFVPPVLLSVVPLSVRQEGLAFVPTVSMAILPVLPLLYSVLPGVPPVCMAGLPGVPPMCMAMLPVVPPCPLSV